MSGEQKVVVSADVVSLIVGVVVEMILEGCVDN